MFSISYIRSYLGVAHLGLVLEPTEVLLLVGGVTRGVHRRLRLRRASEVTRGLVSPRPGLKHEDKGE